MQLAIAASDGGRWDLPGDTQHRHVGGPGCTQRGGGGQNTRARHHGKGADLARGLGIAVRHIGDALFVAAVDYPDVVAFIVQGVEEPVQLHAGQAENSIDAMGDNGFHKGLATGHTGHGRHSKATLKVGQA